MAFLQVNERDHEQRTPEMKVCYTAIFGDYDDLKRPFVTKQPGWKFVCFTDQNIESDYWEIKKVPLIGETPSKTARWYKINAHKCLDSEHSLWLDATFCINTNLNRWWKRFIPPFTTIDHPFDDCIYKDANSCLQLGKGEPEKIKEQINFYYQDGLPEHFGLISSGVLMREHTKEVNAFCEQWWHQVARFSSRDQIAFTYAYWNNPIIRHSIKWNYTTQKEFIHIPHKGKPWRDAKFREMKQMYESKSA